MINYLKELNSEQFDVVKDFYGTNLVIAGAGTGKTHLLTMRIARMIESGVKAENILALTFTNKAAKEMKQRSFKLLGGDAIGLIACTYHSFCAMILREFSQYINVNGNGLKANFNIIDNPEQAIKTILRHRGYKGKTAKDMLKDTQIYSLITNEIVKGIHMNIAIQKEYPDYVGKIQEIRDIADEFQAYKLQHNVVDYTDLLVLCNNLLKNNIDVARELANRYQYIMVDEFQDSNNLQCELLKNLLCDVHRNLMVVGDDMQSIYAFNGANYKNILEFPTNFAPCRMNILERNYRSTQGILNLANAIIKDAPYKFNKNLYTEDNNTKRPKFEWCFNSDEEVERIYRHIASWKNMGANFGNMAILARTSSELNLLESCFVRDKIPYQKYGGIKFFDKAHIKDSLCFLRVLSNFADELAWQRILPLIPGLGAAGAEKIAKTIVTDGYDALVSKQFQGKKYSDWLQVYHNFFLQATKDISTGTFNTYGNVGKPQMSLENQMELLKNSVLDSLFEYAYPEDYDLKLKEYDMFFHLIEDYETATEFLEDILLNGTPIQTTDKDNCITLSTVHSAKGLEWDYVVIMNCIEGGFPSMKSIKSNDVESLEEERRLLYVAVTRAKKDLILMAPQNYGIYGQTMSGELSRFLATETVQRNLL